VSERTFRRVVVTGRLDDAAASRAAAEILTLDAAGDAPIELVVDSGDGTLEAAFALIDAMEAARAPIRALCRGQVGGPAIAVVAAAQHRRALPHTRFRLSAPVVRLSGTPAHLVVESQAQRALLWRLQGRLARVTGRAPEDIADDMRRGRYLDAREALDYRLIDAVG